jgi:hypothetical protein
VGNRKNGNPKKDLRLPFSLVRFFWASKRTERTESNDIKDKSATASSPKANEHIDFGRAKTEQPNSQNY